jgi:hypothetical protein
MSYALQKMATNEFWKQNSHVKIANGQVHHVLLSIYPGHSITRQVYSNFIQAKNCVTNLQMYNKPIKYEKCCGG